MKKNFLFLALTISCAAVFSNAVQAQKPKIGGKSAPIKSSEKSQKTNVAVEGVGIEGVKVGKSTKSEIEKKLGKNYKWITNKKYSYQMTYPNGVSFYFCQAEKQPQVFDIEMRSPYEVKTSRGVVLRKSTLAEVEKIYGKAQTGLRYRGIEFYYDTVGGKKLVTTIDVVENKGLRQCATEKEKTIVTIEKKTVKTVKPKNKPAK